MQIRNAGSDNQHVVTTSHSTSHDHRLKPGTYTLWSKNSAAASSTISRSSIGMLLQGVSERLVAVQKERDHTQEMDKQEARLQGKNIKTEWYDYSGCEKKYVH